MITPACHLEGSAYLQLCCSSILQSKREEYTKSSLLLTEGGGGSGEGLNMLTQYLCSLLTHLVHFGNNELSVNYAWSHHAWALYYTIILYACTVMKKHHFTMYIWNCIKHICFFNLSELSSQNKNRTSPDITEIHWAKLFNMIFE